MLILTLYRLFIAADMADEKEGGMEAIKSPKGDQPSLDIPANDPEMEGLSLYEKKALLVNRELDSHGMGKYQVRRLQNSQLRLY